MAEVGRRAVIAVVGAALFGVVASAPAQATSAGQEFSEHVRACQQAMGFSGTHNPGVMHQGFSGWDPSHSC